MEVTTMTTNITPKMQADFNALASGQYDNFCLFSCFADGRPTAAICTVEQKGEERIIKPLFIAVTDDMDLKDHDGTVPTQETEVVHV
jgi:hypothetical protein